MKIIKLLILIIFLFPLSVNAKSNGVFIKCPEKIEEGKEFECSLEGYSDFEVSAIELVYELPLDVEFIRFDKDTKWEGSEDNKVILLYTDENKIEEFNIGSIKLKSKENIDNLEIKLLKVSFGDKNFNEVIITEENVNQVENNLKDDVKKKNNNIYYVIIILIIGVLAFVISYYIKKGVNNNEK